MKRSLLFLGFLGAGLVPLAGADDPARPSAASERVQQFQRDRELIQVVVQGSLRLAGEEDPLQRAGYCNGVAEHFAAAIRRAAEKGEAARVAELGQHLSTLLVHGVAPNLNLARRQIPIGSTLETRLQEVRDRAAEIVAPLEQQLQRTSDAANQKQIQHILKALQACPDNRHAVPKRK